MSLGKKFFHQNPADSSGSGAASAQEGLILHLDANDEDSIESGGANVGNGSGTWFDISSHDLTIPLSDKSANLQFHLNLSDSSSYIGLGTTFNDISGNNIPITIGTNSSATYTYGQDLGGYIDIQANTTNETWTIPHSNDTHLSSTDGFSYEYWLYFDTTGNDTHQFYLKGQDASNYDTYFYLHESAGWYFQVYGIGSHFIHNADKLLDQWVHVVFTMSTPTNPVQKLYINGTLVKTVNASGTVTNTSSYDTNIGSVLGDNNDIYGRLGCVRLYNTVLNPSEVGQNFRHGRNLVYTSIITSKDSATQGTLITAPPTQGTIHSTNLALSLDANGYSSGTWSNTANSSYNGTINGATYVNNDNSDYFDLDGSNDFVEVNTYAGVDIGSGGLSVEVWALCQGTSGTDTIVSNIGSDLYGYQLLNSGTDVKLYIYEDESVIVNQTASSSTVVGTWNHYVFTVASNSSGAAVKVYINGIEKIDTTLGSAYSGSSTNFNIGKYPYAPSTRYFEGKIGQVRTYTSALTTTEVNTNYNATKDLYQGATNIELHLDANGYSSGAWSDSSGNSRNGTITDAVHTNDNNSDYFTFDGATGTSGDKVVVPHTTDLDIVQDFSIEMWVWRNDDTDHCLINKGPNNTNSWDISFGASSGFGYQFNSYDGNAQVRTGTGDFTSANRWEHIVLTYDNETKKPDFFIDGVLRVGHTQTAGSLPNGNSNDLIIGGYYQYPARHGWNGRIAQVRFYKGKLTQDQVITNYNATKSLYQNPSLKMYLDSGDDSTLTATTWSDKANSNDGTFTNFPSSLTDFYDKELGNFIEFVSGDKVLVSGSDLNPANTKSIEVWFNGDAMTSSHYLISNWSGSGNNYGYHLYVYQNTLKSWVYNQAQSGYFVQLTSGGTVTTGTWHHAVLTIGPSASDNRIYLDGELKETGSSTSGTFPTTAAHNGIIIGAYGSANTYDGKIALVRTYDTQLTTQQVVQNYLASKKYYPKENHATISGATFTYASTPYYFDLVSNDYFRTSSISITWTFGFAYEIYFKADTNTQSYPISTSGSTNPSLSWRNYSGWKLVAFHYRSSSEVDYLESDATSTGQWYHIIYTANDSGGQIYTNGSLSDSTTNSVRTGNYNDYFEIGRLSGGNYLDGKIGMVKIHAKHLSSTEVSANYDATKSTYGLS